MPAIQPSAIPGQKSTNGTHGSSAIGQLGGKSPMQEKRERQAEESKPPEQTVDSRFLTVLASHIEAAWQRNQNAKLEVEQRMLKSLRQRQRQYEADVWAAIQEQGGSQHYDGLTTTKCRAAESWIMDVLVPSGDRPWDIEPTTLPEVSPEIKQKLEQTAMQGVAREAQKAVEMGMEVNGEMMAHIAEMVRERMEEVYEEVSQEEAETKAKKMADQIDDQFQEGGWYTEFKGVIRDFVTFPACFVMGPIFRRRRRSKYTHVNGKWMPQVAYEVVQEYCRVSPFDVYPESDASSVQDGDVFVRQRLSAKELSAFRNVPGYDTEAINAVLETYGQGGLRNWTVIDQARSDAEGRDQRLYESNKIDTLRFWGSVRGQWLIDHVESRGTRINIDDIDPHEYYEIDAIKVGQYIIRAIINPDKLGRKPLSKASYEEVPGAFWGNGIPDLLRDDQQACNAMARAIVNNSALSSGPLVERNIDRTQGDDGRIYPWKEYLATDDQMRSGSKAVQFYAIPNNTDQMLKVWEKFLQRADENSGVPAYAHGSEDVGGAGDTASGLSMLMSSSSKLLRMAIYNMDTGIVETTVERTYHHNMLFSDNEDIKGDLKVVPKGATVLMIREQMAARQGEFADSTNNPVDLQLMGLEGRRSLRRSQAKNLNLSPDDLFPENAQQQLPMEQRPQQTANTQGGVNQGPVGSQQPRATDRAGRPQQDFQRQ